MFENNPEQEVKVSINQVNPDSLSDEVKKKIGNKPVIDINISIGGEKLKWKNDNKKIKVSIPYTLTKEEKENPHKVIAVYIDDDGNIIPLTSANYDPVSGSIVFETNHTSYYGVQYVEKSFSDIGEYVWAQKAIEALAARGVINGTSQTTFVPQNNITRADFVSLVVRFFDLDKEFSNNFADVDKNAYYYNAVGIAKVTGIVSGTGDNMFKPLDLITRQDMMVIIKRTLSITGNIDNLTVDSENRLSDFEDNKNVAHYAIDSVDYLITRGIVHGDGKNINPTDSTLRSEVAALLYNLLNRLY